MTRKSLLLIAFSLVIAANARGVPPDVQASPARQSVRTDSTQIVDWGSIQVLNLETAQRIALADNPSLQAAAARVRQARARVLQARAAYWPRLDAGASASKVWLSGNAYETSLQSARFFDPQADVADPEDYYQADLTASWTLFDGFQRRFSNAFARSGEQESEASRREGRRLLLSAVASSYYGAQLARENIAIAQADSDFNQRQLTEAQARRRVGTGSLSDELNFEIRGNSAKTSLIESQRQYETALIGLAALMGIPEADFPSHIRLEQLEPEAPEDLAHPSVQPLINYAQEHRPDVLQSQMALERLNANVGVARSEFWPSVNLSASVDGSRSNSGDFEEDDFGQSVAVAFSYNLFSGGGRIARLREAKEQQIEAEKNLEDTRIAVCSDVNEALANLKSTQEQLALQRTNTALVQRTRDLVQKEYTAGQASLVRLNEAQKDLITAQGLLAQARVSLRQAWHNLHTATAQVLTAFEE